MDFSLLLNSVLLDSLAPEQRPALSGHRAEKPLPGGHRGGEHLQPATQLHAGHPLPVYLQRHLRHQ